MNLNNVITLNDYAIQHGLDYPRLRRMARKHEFDAPFKFGNTWFVDANTDAPAMSERKTRTRDDGRSRFVVYINRGTDDEQTRGMDELARVRDIVGYDNVVDLRDVRMARKLANAERDRVAIAATTDDDDDVALHGVPMRELSDGTLIVDDGNGANG